jgi:CheY-like chemotaxis protein
MFQAQKHETVGAQDGVEALAVLKKMQRLPDVIVLDIMMPRMNGFEFLKLVKSDQKFSSIPVVILSNLYGQEDRKKGLDLGAALFLVKSEHTPNDIVKQTLSVVMK